MDKAEKDRLVQELNELSDMKWLSEELRKQRRDRMIEISKILLAEHYWYTRRHEEPTSSNS